MEGWDVDLPTYIEANVVCTFLLKLGWVCCYILVYGLRPVLIRPKKIGARIRVEQYYLQASFWPQPCSSCRPFCTSQELEPIRLDWTLRRGPNMISSN